MLNLSLLKDKVHRLRSEYEHATKTLRTEKVQVIAQRKRVKRTQKSQQICQLVAQGIQQQAHDQIANVVTRCLQTVFGKNHEFRILFEKKRGKTEARLVFLKNGREENPKEGAGVGRMDVAAFALRLACLLLERPKKRRLMILDEPFRCLSKSNRPQMAELLETLAEELDFQFVLVTHDEEFQIGKVIQIV